MRWNPVPLPSGSYADTARPWSQQEWVNWLPVKAERPGARSDVIGRDVPGLYPFAVVGDGPIRGSHNAEGSWFIVSGDTLYQVGTDGTATELGAIPGAGRVSMAHNQITGGNEVVIANGAGYVYDTTTDTLTQITDEGFPGAKSVRFLGQMIVAVEPFGRFWFHSDLADATSYNTINRYEAEGSPDLILHVEPSQGEALVFGKRTIEVWANVVTENASFQRSAVIERGAASGHAIVTLDNSCIFLGDDGILYRLNGYTPVPISTRAWENAIRGEDLSKAIAFTWEDAGHKVFYLTFPSGKTYGFDVAQGEMHRRQSKGLDRWRLNTLTPFNNAWYGGDYASGRIYRLDWDYHKEWLDDEIVRRCRPPVMHDGGNAVRVHAMRFEVDMGPAVTEAPIPPATPNISITGDVGNGFVGNPVSYQYTLSGGNPPRVATILSGTLIPGCTMSESGLVTGTRTTVGEHSWVAQVEDVDGRTDTVADSSITGIAPPTVIMGAHAYSGNVGSLVYDGASPLVSLCNNVMPVASSDGMFVAGRATATAVLGIYEYNMVTGVYAAATITGTAPDYSATTAIQWLAMSSDGTRVYSISSGTDTIVTLERTGAGAYSVTQTLATGLPTTGTAGGMTAVALSPDEDRLAVTVENGRTRTYTIAENGSLTLEHTSADGTVFSNCKRVDWVGRYIVHGDNHPSGTIRVLDADDALAVKASILTSDSYTIGFDADAAYLYTVGASAPYTLTVHAFNPTAGTLTAGSTYVTNKEPYAGSRLSPARGTMLLLDALNTDGTLYTVSGATLTAGEVLANGFSNGFFSNPERVP